MIDPLVTSVAAADGTALHTEVHLPPGRDPSSGPWPVELGRTPYGAVHTREAAAWRAGDGIVVVVQDVRGRHGSGGRFDLGTADDADAAATIAWLRRQPWCDGRIALTGLSYVAATQWRALQAPPAERPGVVSAAPMMGPGWWRGMSFRRGGAVELALAAHWLVRQAADDPWTPDALRSPMLLRAFEVDQVVDRPGGGPAAVLADRALAHPALGRWELADPIEVAGNPVFERMWADVWRTPPPAEPPVPEAPRAAPPTLVLAGWYDLWCADAVRAHASLAAAAVAEGRGAPHRLVIVPAGHGCDPLREHRLPPEASRFGLDVDHRWALEHLGVGPRELRDLEPVTYWVLGEGWRTAASWPPPEAVPVQLELAADGTLVAPPGPLGSGARTGPAAAGVRSWLHDPDDPVPTRGGVGILLPPGPVDRSDVSGGARGDVVSFDLEPLDRDVVIAGCVRAMVELVADARDADLHATLTDVAPDGRAVTVIDGITRARWRGGGPTERLLDPGEPTAVPVDLGPIAWRLRAGHRLRLDLAGSCFPRYDRNAGTGAAEGTDRAGDARPVRMGVVCGAGRSRLELDVVA